MPGTPRISLVMTDLSHMPRREALRALIGGAAAAGLALSRPLQAALPGADEIAFEVLRDGRSIGHHRVSFRREARDLHVEIDIALEVKLLFLTVFRYRHRNHEVWRDGRLVAIDTKTDDDGEAFWLRGRSAANGLAVEGSSGRFLAPADIMPTSYWNPDSVKRSRMLDTQRGRLIQVAIVPAGLETVELAGRPVEARRFAVTGDLVLDLWYTAAGEWAKIAFEARGAEIAYTRKGGPARLAGTEAPGRDK